VSLPNSRLQAAIDLLLTFLKKKFDQSMPIPEDLSSIESTASTSVYLALIGDDVIPGIGSR
jgi:hypothetical protein